MSRFVTVAKKNEVQPGVLKVVSVEGKEIVLTIDRNIQSRAEEIFNIADAWPASGRCYGIRDVVARL